MLTDTEMLRERIGQSGYKISFIAHKLNLSYQGLLNKINNKSEFKASEIQVLSDLLSLSGNDKAAIFYLKVALPTLWWIVLNQSSFYCSQNILKRRPVVFDNAFTPMCHVVKICFRSFDFSSR